MPFLGPSDPLSRRVRNFPAPECLDALLSRFENSRLSLPKPQLATTTCGHKPLAFCPHRSLFRAPMRGTPTKEAPWRRFYLHGASTPMRLLPPWGRFGANFSLGLSERARCPSPERATCPALFNRIPSHFAEPNPFAAVARVEASTCECLLLGLPKLSLGFSKTAAPLVPRRRSKPLPKASPRPGYSTSVAKGGNLGEI